MVEEGSLTTIPPLLVRNLLTSIFIYADKSLLTDFAKSYKLLQLLRYFLVSAFLFLLRLLPSLFPSLDSSPPQNYDDFPLKAPDTEIHAASGGGSGIARALSQLLSIVNDIPVSSRKYEVVRSLAERVLDENLRDGSEALREVNCAALSAAFSRTLSQLGDAAADRGRYGGDSGGGDDVTAGMMMREGRKVNRVMKAVRYCGDVAWTRFGKARRREVNRCGGSAEKLAAEVLWLAQKMAASGCVEEAVGKWASATNLGWLSLSAEPRLQGSLVKVSAFLFEQAKDLGSVDDEEMKKEQHRQTKMKMLLSWLPLLCRASNGTDAPVLSIRERSDLEKVLEETIEMLEPEQEQEKVLSLWLHHFTYCPSSDWPNLHKCYTRWCNESRRRFLLQ